jgi:hypothetical protein
VGALSSATWTRILASDKLPVGFLDELPLAIAAFTNPGVVK